MPRNASRLGLSGRFPRASAVFAKIFTKCVGLCASGAQPSLRLCKTPGHMFSRNRSSWLLSESLRTSRLFLHVARRISLSGARQKANGCAKNEVRDDLRGGTRGIRRRPRKCTVYSVFLKKRMASAAFAKSRMAHGPRQGRVAHGVARRKKRRASDAACRKANGVQWQPSKIAIGMPWTRTSTTFFITATRVSFS